MPATCAQADAVAREEPRHERSGHRPTQSLLLESPILDAEKEARRLLRALDDTLDDLVSDGVLSRDAADLLLQHARSQLEDRLGHSIRRPRHDLMQLEMRIEPQRMVTLGDLLPHRESPTIDREDVLDALAADGDLELGDLLGAFLDPEVDLSEMPEATREDALRALLLAWLLQAMTQAATTPESEHERAHHCPAHGLRG